MRSASRSSCSSSASGRSVQSARLYAQLQAEMFSSYTRLEKKGEARSVWWVRHADAGFAWSFGPDSSNAETGELN